VIPRSRRSLCKDQSFGDRDNAYTKADKWPAEGTLQAKEEVGRGGGAHRVRLWSCHFFLHSSCQIQLKFIEIFIKFQ